MYPQAIPDFPISRLPAILCDDTSRPHAAATLRLARPGIGNLGQRARNAAVNARDIHVNNQGGDDRADGSHLRPEITHGGPVRTIAKALRLAEAGDRIVLAKTSEPYRESLSLTGSKHGGSPLGPLVIEGNGAVLDGSARCRTTPGDISWGTSFTSSPRKWATSSCFFPAAQATRHPLERSTPGLPPLEPLEWCFIEGRIYFRVESGRLPRDYRAACCRLRSGLTLYHVRDVVIRNLVVQGFQFDGIATSDAVRDARLEGVTAHGNGRSGVSVSGDFDRRDRRLRVGRQRRQPTSHRGFRRDVHPR